MIGFCSWAELGKICFFVQNSVFFVGNFRADILESFVFLMV
jgi:hypothetical protein